MEDVKELQSKKKTNKTSSTSSVKKSKVTKKASELSNEELLEQILNKKKTKKTTTKKASSTEPKSTSVKKTVKKTKQFNELENDFIYDQIKNSKKKTKKTTTKKEEVKVVPKVEEVKMEEPKVEEPKVQVEELKQEEAYDTYNSLEESVKRKKEIKDDFEEFITEIENAKLLKEIKEALARDEVVYVQPGYKVSSKEAIETIDNQINERLKEKTLKPKKSSVRKSKKPIVLLIGFVLFVVCLIFVVNGVIEGYRYAQEQERIKEEERKRIEEENRLKKLYDDCLVRPLDENDTSEEISAYVTDLNKYISKNYEMSVMYEDLTYGFTYSYNESKSYYAASTIKSLGAIYIYEKAYKGEIDLDDTMVYSSKYYRGASKGMKKHKYGDKVKLRDLVKYSVIYSDNTAHNMIVNYVGVDKLRAYGKELGADKTHLNGDLFGYIDLSDANIYMKKLYDVINNTGDYGRELENYFLDAEQNSLSLEEYDIKAAHKYGEYEYVYHDIGIVYTEKPYVVAVLTHEGRHDYDSIIKDINGRVYALHNMYYSNRESYCKNSVYGK